MKESIAAGGAAAAFAVLHHAGSRWGATNEELVCPCWPITCSSTRKRRTTHAMTIGRTTG